MDSEGGTRMDDLLALHPSSLMGTRRTRRPFSRYGRCTIVPHEQALPYPVPSKPSSALTCFETTPRQGHAVGSWRGGCKKTKKPARITSPQSRKLRTALFGGYETGSFELYCPQASKPSREGQWDEFGEEDGLGRQYRDGRPPRKSSRLTPLPCRGPEERDAPYCTMVCARLCYTSKLCPTRGPPLPLRPSRVSR
jgi:hypothetical protein